MNTRFFFQRALLSLLALMAVSVARADDAADTLTRCIAESRRLFHDGVDGSVAEAGLTGLSQAAVNSRRWQFDLAVNLLRVTFSAQDATDPETAVRAARRALVHLDLALAAYADMPKRQSEIQDMRGTIFERFLDDIPSAVTSCLEAVRLNPASEAAADHLRRCQALAAPVADATIATTATPVGGTVQSTEIATAPATDTTAAGTTQTTTTTP